MTKRHRESSAEELALWRHAMKGALPLDPGAVPAEEQLPAPAAEAPAPETPQPAPPPAGREARSAFAGPRPLRPLDPLRPVDLDRRTWLRLRRGMMPLAARLDLHGDTQEEAHDRLGRFLAAAQGLDRRCVLVITGRGSRKGGILRDMVPRWLAEAPNRARVLSYSPAQPRHGGAGALYVLLRRRRPG